MSSFVSLCLLLPTNPQLSLTQKSVDLNNLRRRTYARCGSNASFLKIYFDEGRKLCLSFSIDVSSSSVHRLIQQLFECPSHFQDLKEKLVLLLPNLQDDRDTNTCVSQGLQAVCQHCCSHGFIGLIILKIM